MKTYILSELLSALGISDFEFADRTTSQMTQGYHGTDAGSDALEGELEDVLSTANAEDYDSLHCLLSDCLSVANDRLGDARAQVDADRMQSLREDVAERAEKLTSKWNDDTCDAVYALAEKFYTFEDTNAVCTDDKTLDEAIRAHLQDNDMLDKVYSARWNVGERYGKLVNGWRSKAGCGSEYAHMTDDDAAAQCTTHEHSVWRDVYTIDGLWTARVIHRNPIDRPDDDAS